MSECGRVHSEGRPLLSPLSQQIILLAVPKTSPSTRPFFIRICPRQGGAEINFRSGINSALTLVTSLGLPTEPLSWRVPIQRRPLFNAESTYDWQIAFAEVVRLLRQLLIHQRSGAGFEANQRHSCSKTAVLCCILATIWRLWISFLSWTIATVDVVKLSLVMCNRYN